MRNVDLNAIIVTDLKNISTDGGNILHYMKSTDAGFNKFGEVYFSWIKKNSIKAWKKHLRMTLNLAVPLGKVKFVFHNPDQPKVFREEIIGQDNYKRLTVPPGTWFGFQGIYYKPSLVANVSDILHDENEILRVQQKHFSFSWGKCL